MQRWNEETTLAELLDDPLIGMLMHSDGIDRDCIEQMLATIAKGRTWVAATECLQ